jgi:hypothetical membrane protein
MTGSLSIIFFREHFEWFGLTACLIVSAALIIPIPLYSGRAGEKYSPLNHFVSELGEAGVSRGAWIFNGGMIAAGLLFLPFTLGLAFTINNSWAMAGMVAGLFAAFWLILIGVFPMNKLKWHILAALSFFYCGLATILLFSLAIWMQVEEALPIPREFVWIGIVCVLIYILFLTKNPLQPRDPKVMDFLRVDSSFNRPVIWVMPISEWLVVIVSTLWYLSTALVIIYRNL